MERWILNKNMKLTAILLSLLVYFQGAYAQNNFLNLTIPVGPGEMLVTHPSMCELYLEEYVDYGNSEFGEIVPELLFDLPEPLHSICAIYNSSGQAKGYLGGWGKWCVTTAMHSETAMRAACTFACDDMNLSNTNLELPMSVEQRLADLSPDGQTNATLAIIDEWMVELLETGEDGPALEQAMQVSSSFRLSVHGCRLHECEDVAQCQRVADMAFEEILESGIELDIDMDAFDNLEDARELARRLGSHL